MIGGSFTSTSQTPLQKQSERSAARKVIVEHRVKCWPQFFNPILSGEKTHDLRRSNDRNFRVGDLLRLQEFDPKTNRYSWPAPGSEDTELGVLMELEVGHGETEVYPGSSSLRLCA
jgi:Domain of unknown function (DUF3850)